MEYSHFKVQGGIASGVLCSKCNSENVNVEGQINYGFFFLEYLPFIPLSKDLILTCNSCQHSLDNSHLEVDLYQSLKKRLFKLYLIFPLYAGAILTALALCIWQYQAYQERVQLQHYIAEPRVNDFYFLDYRAIGENLRPHEKYRLAKVTVVNDQEVSVVYGRYMYSRPTSLRTDIQGGMVIDSRYFNQREHTFSIQQFQQLYQDDAVLDVLRPKSNRLYGNVVVNEVSINKRYKTLARMYNDQGLAFINNSHIDGNIENAREYFLKAANLGYSQGQVNLAKSYIMEKSTGINTQALGWLSKAALQGNEEAIALYLENCKSAYGCFKNEFVQQMELAGYEVTL